MLEIFHQPGLDHNAEPNLQNMENHISTDSTVVRADQNLSCDLQGEAVVLNLQSGTYFGLNPLGARIWELIAKPSKVSEVLKELLKEYEVDVHQCEEDLLSFLKQLQAHNLIKISENRE